MFDTFLSLFGELHVPVLFATIAVILYSDHQAFLYLQGKKQTLSAKFVHRSHIAVWAGLLMMIVTGVSLTLPALEYRLSEPAFYIKMGFILVLIFNAYAIGKLSKLALNTPFKTLTTEQQKTLIASGILSASGWVGAMLIGAFFL